ncbi:transcriptional regulator (plasmid) [Deinococcus aetherius]|uniref:Transcriptional regulator n=1 Tax=Deinococcus aetherius TaxID=200252 RepID=A0ABM8AJD9_9DEIO|nr:helix-turn-helix domain-containing protein [Deinococcus aetherius]BDP43914.1 transcriptional regulator [Deinococcus aetherius]
MAVSGKRILTVDGEVSLPVLKALGSETRLLILSLLSHNVMNLAELTAALGLPHATVSFNLKHLEEAGLLHVQTVPGTRGTQKLISKRYDELHVRLPGSVAEAAPDVVAVSMPIGNYRFAQVVPTCGLAGDFQFIGTLDDPRSFFEPEHVFAQLLWFRSGFVEYAFPNNLPFGAFATELALSMELCSEAPQYDPEWPSDVTVWINDVEIGTWTCPGDFGGKRGRLTPQWWPDDQTMYGLLKRWRVTGEGTSVDDERVSDVTLGDLGLEGQHHVAVRIGVREDARHVGGLNLFGRRCGNHAQDLLMQVRYEFSQDTKPYRVK